MTMPWVRLDGTLFSHDKTLWLVAQRQGLEALAVYCMALGWSGANHTDGHVPAAALGMLHGKQAHARLLVEARLWEHVEGGGWQIRNWALRQELAVVSEAKRKARQAGAAKTNCRRYHPPGCTCASDSQVIPMPRRPRQ